MCEPGARPLPPLDRRAVGIVVAPPLPQAMGGLLGGDDDVDEDCFCRTLAPRPRTPSSCLRAYIDSHVCRCPCLCVHLCLHPCIHL